MPVEGFAIGAGFEQHPDTGPLAGVDGNVQWRQAVFVRFVQCRVLSEHLPHAFGVASARGLMDFGSVGYRQRREQSDDRSHVARISNCRRALVPGNTRD